MIREFGPKEDEEQAPEAVFYSGDSDDFSATIFPGDDVKS